MDGANYTVTASARICPGITMALPSPHEVMAMAGGEFFRLTGERTSPRTPIRGRYPPPFVLPAEAGIHGGGRSGHSVDLPLRYRGGYPRPRPVGTGFPRYDEWECGRPGGLFSEETVDRRDLAE